MKLVSRSLTLVEYDTWLPIISQPFITTHWPVVNANKRTELRVKIRQTITYMTKQPINKQHQSTAPLWWEYRHKALSAQCRLPGASSGPAGCRTWTLPASGYDCEPCPWSSGCLRRWMPVRKCAASAVCACSIVSLPARHFLASVPFPVLVQGHQRSENQKDNLEFTIRF